MAIILELRYLVTENFLDYICLPENRSGSHMHMQICISRFNETSDTPCKNTQTIKYMYTCINVCVHIMCKRQNFRLRQCSRILHVPRNLKMHIPMLHDLPRDLRALPRTKQLPIWILIHLVPRKYSQGPIKIMVTLLRITKQHFGYTSTPCKLWN